MVEITRPRKTETALNWDVALAQVDGDRQLLAELCTMFLQDCPHLLKKAYVSIENGDPVTLERAAHTLSGRLAFFGLIGARERASELEVAGRKKDLNCALEVFVGIESEMEPILSEFESFVREQDL